jgi:uroporphyrinogen-III synthase
MPNHRTIVLTQALGRATALARHLGANGWPVRCWPLTAIDPISALDWDAVAADLAASRWVLLPSPGAVDVVMSAWSCRGAVWPPELGLGLVGPGSAEALTAWLHRIPGLASARVRVPERPPHDAQALLALPQFHRLAGVPVTVLRGEDGQQAWLSTLRARGAVLRTWTVYRAREQAPPDGAGAWLARCHATGVGVGFVVASLRAGRQLSAFAREQPCSGWLWDQPVLTQHPRIAEDLRTQGWRNVVQHITGAAGLLAAIESLDSAQS